jgi:hypothetical protein
MIKTASWFTQLPPDHMKIGISRGVPRRMAAGYRIYRKLAPGPWFNRVPTEEYLRRYSGEILSVLDPREVHDRLVELAGDKIPTMVCYERAGSGSWCHRALAARWLADGLGVAVPEVGHEQLDQDRHPLLPQELLV